MILASLVSCWDFSILCYLYFKLKIYEDCQEYMICKRSLIIKKVIDHNIFIIWLISEIKKCWHNTYTIKSLYFPIRFNFEWPRIKYILTKISISILPYYHTPKSFFYILTGDSDLFNRHNITMERFKPLYAFIYISCYFFMKLVMISCFSGLNYERHCSFLDELVIVNLFFET